MSTYEPLAVVQQRATSAVRGDDAMAEDRDGRGQRGYAPRLLPVPAAWWTTPMVAARTLRAEPEAASAARRFTGEIVASWGLHAYLDRAQTIIDELVVNAVQHGMRGGVPRDEDAARDDAGRCGTPLRVCVLRRTSELMLAALDPSGDPPMPRPPDVSVESGRGLQIVHALSDVWGWSPLAGRGKAVWAVLRVR